MNLADTASVALHPILLQRLRRGMLWFFLFLCVSTSIFIGWTILDHYQRTTADANARMVTLAKALETHVSKLPSAPRVVYPSISSANAAALLAKNKKL